MALQDDLRVRRDPRSPPAARGAVRWDLVLAWAVVLGPILALAVVVALRQRVGDLEERLVRDASELFARSHPRPVHVDAPTPGAMGEAIRAHLPPLEAAAKGFAKGDPDVERAGAVVAGDAPVTALPSTFAAGLHRLAPDLDGLLAATRAERADLLATRDPLAPLDDGGWLGWQLAATLAGVRMRLALAAGAPRDAVRDGLDGLALGRDAAIARGLIGRMVAAAVVARLTPPLAAAIDALPDPRSRVDAVRRVRAIRDAFPPLSRTLADEFTLTPLFAGDALPAAVRRALPAGAAPLVRDGLREPPWWQRLAIRDAWRDLRSAQDALVRAADLPDRERPAAFDAATARLTRCLNPFPALALPDYRRYARRSEDAARRLDALVLAAAAGVFRDERRRWPASVAEVAAAGGLEAEEARRLAEVAAEPRDGGRALALRVPLPGRDERALEELVIVLRGRP